MAKKKVLSWGFGCLLLETEESSKKVAKVWCRTCPEFYGQAISQPMLASSKEAVKKIQVFLLLMTTVIKKNNFGYHLSNINTFETLSFFCGGEYMVITFIPWNLYNGTIKKALGWSSIKTTLCLLFNMGDKVATRTTQKTEEADKIEPHRLDRTQSGGAAAWWIKDLACPSLAALWIINTVK